MSCLIPVMKTSFPTDSENREPDNCLRCPECPTERNTMLSKNHKSSLTSLNATSDRSVESPAGAIAADALANPPLAEDILTASQVDLILCSFYACAPVTAKRWRLSDLAFPKPCTPEVARPRWRRTDVMEWIKSH